MPWFRSLALFVVVALLSACAGPKIPFDRSGAAHVKTIGIVTPRFPDGPTVELATSVGQSFGLVGALVDVAMTAERSARFNRILEQQGFVTSDVFIKHLSDTLSSRGYNVVNVPVAREGTDFIASYPPATDTKVDAYLDTVIVTYGYIAAGIGPNTPYRPRFLVRARLANATDTAVLMQDAVIYNHVGPAGFQQQSVTLAPDGAHAFGTIDRLTADPDNAVRGLRTATEKAAEAISQLLR